MTHSAAADRAAARHSAQNVPGPAPAVGYVRQPPARLAARHHPGIADRPGQVLVPRPQARSSFRAYPVAADTYYRWDAFRHDPFCHGLSLVGVCDNRIGTVHSSARAASRSQRHDPRRQHSSACPGTGPAGLPHDGTRCCRAPQAVRRQCRCGNTAEPPSLAAQDGDGALADSGPGGEHSFARTGPTGGWPRSLQPSPHPPISQTVVSASAPRGAGATAGFIAAGERTSPMAAAVPPPIRSSDPHRTTLIRRHLPQ